MTQKRDPLANPLFQDGLLDETAKLGVVRARFEGFDRDSFEDLIAGYSSMKVLTYSSSVPIINKAAEQLERLEVVFGRADILGDMGSYFYLFVLSQFYPTLRFHPAGDIGIAILK